MRFPGYFNENDIPKEKKQVVARLSAMEADGWKALEGMTIDEPNALQAEAEGAIYEVDDFGSVRFDNQHDQMILRAREAIKDRRYRIRKAEDRRRSEQIKRRNAIIGAAEHIRMAADLMDEACGIGRYEPYWAGLLPSVPRDFSPQDMTDGELNDAIKACDRLHDPLPSCELFSMLATPSAKSLASELKAHADEYNARAATLMDNKAAAIAELAARKASAEASETRKEVLNDNIDHVIAELENRIKELEASR